MIEIERKFLIDPTKLPGCIKPIRIAQGYLSLDKARTVRIRIADKTGFITIKGESSENGLSRFEFETEIGYDDACKLLEMCTGVIDKSRYHVIHRGKLWELDYFHGSNEGLYVGEIELASEDEEFDIPSWAIMEVTGNPRFYNSNLMQHPFNTW